MTTTQHTTLRRPLRAISLGLALAMGTIAPLSGCRGERSDNTPRQFFPDLDDQMKWKPQGKSEFFADGRTMRLPVPGTVAFGRTSQVSDQPWAETYMTQRAALLREDDAFFRGVDESGAYLARIPVAPSRAMIERGMERFNIYCSACHGYEGDAKGTVGARWSYPVANFHDPKYRDAAENTGKDGYLFHVVRNGVIGGDGKQKMPGYAHALNEQDAWAVVAYLRALQNARLATLDDVPTTEREILQRQRASAGQTATTADATSHSATNGGAK
ncbi:MAG: cytochrome c [Phycisphaeraceae bacterium]|nr:MAG: cytochrome c [Phycisphaeraceae bacterium]